MNISEKNRIIENYRKLFLEHGDGPAVGQWSEEGQRFRFEKLTQIGDLAGKTVLDVGCGIGDLYPFLCNRYGWVRYIGIDIVPELIDSAARKYPAATFRCVDLVGEDFRGEFDYILMSGVFNNERQNATEFLYRMISAAFELCKQGMGFNFTSRFASRYDEDMAYHDPMEILRFCLDHVSTKVTMSHHYERCDMAVFVYR